MKIFVTAKPRSKSEHIEKIDETHFVVAVSAPPIKGLANRAITQALANHFGVAPSQVSLVSGFSAKQKLFEVKTTV